MTALITRTVNQEHVDRVLATKRALKLHRGLPDQPGRYSAALFASTRTQEFR